MKDYLEFKSQFVHKNKSSSFRRGVDEIEEAMRLERNHSEIITLKNMSDDAILATFEETRTLLENLFVSRINISDRLNIGNGLDYLTILFRIVTSDQQQKMYAQIVKQFSKDEMKYTGNRIVSIPNILII